MVLVLDKEMYFNPHFMELSNWEVVGGHKAGKGLDGKEYLQYYEHHNQAQVTQQALWSRS